MTTKTYALALLTAVAVLAIAGCGGGSETTSSEPTSSEPTSSEASSGEGGGSTLKAGTVPGLGTVLVDSEGFTMYTFGKDKGSTSACNGPCAEGWPPVTTQGTPSAGEGAMSSKIGTTKRQDGTMQVTYAGHPLYTYVGDSGPGEANGNGSTAFGGVWLAVSESGSSVEGTASGGGEAESAPSESSEGGGGGYGY